MKIRSERYDAAFSVYHDLGAWLLSLKRGSTEEPDEGNLHVRVCREGTE